MNEALRLLALYVRDLLSYDEQLIRIGRQNSEITDFTLAYIGVDSLGAARRIASGQTYDGTAETQKLGDQWLVPCTLAFYGTGAHARAADFVLRQRSQAALELQETLGAAVYLTSSLTDVKVLTGQQFGERIEIELNLQYSEGVEISTKRIDTAQLTVQSEQGQESIP